MLPSSKGRSHVFDSGCRYFITRSGFHSSRKSSFSASRRVQPGRAHQEPRRVRRRSTGNPSKIPKRSGPASQRIFTGSSHGTRCWTGICPGPSGLWAAKMNLSYNCVDRHALGTRRDKTALIWEGEPGEVRRLTYAELHHRSAEALPTGSSRSASRRATASPSTWA